MVNVMWRGCRALEFYVERATTSEGWIPAIAMGAAFFMVVLDTSIVNLARDADDMARRSSVLPCLRQPIPRSLAAWAAAQPMGVAGRNWRCADRPVRRAGGDRLGDRHG